MYSTYLLVNSSPGATGVLEAPLIYSDLVPCWEGCLLLVKGLKGIVEPDNLLTLPVAKVRPLQIVQAANKGLHLVPARYSPGVTVHLQINVRIVSTFFTALRGCSDITHKYVN